jgi:hypothetical protein
MQMWPFFGWRSGCSSISRVSWASSVPQVAKPKGLWEGLGQGFSLGWEGVGGWNGGIEQRCQGKDTILGASEVIWGLQERDGSLYRQDFSL